MRLRALVLCLVASAAIASAQDHEVFIPAVASAAGEGDAFFVTDVRIFNPDPLNTITVRLSYLERRTDNTDAEEVPVEIGPRQGAALNDVVATVFQISGAGGLRLRSDSEFYATSRTYNAGGTSGTFGQFIPGQTPEEALERGILLQVVNDPTSTGFRANVGFANPGESSVKVTVRVFDLVGGEMLGEFTRTLKPLAVLQVNNVFGEIGSANVVVGNASVEFEAEAPVLAYASVVDNTSDDPIYVLPIADSGTSIDDNSPPEGTITSPTGNETILVGESVTFAGGVSDPNGDDVTVEWDFGDGVTSTQLNPGEHTYSDPGSYIVTLTATDARGLSDPTPDTRTIQVDEAAQQASFSRVQSEVFSQSCALSGCHAGGSPAQGLNLSARQAYNEIVGQSSSQQPSLDLIEPGDPDNSYLWLKVIGDSSISGSRMPRGGARLSQEKLDLLRAWIEAGAENN